MSPIPSISAANPNPQYNPYQDYQNYNYLPSQAPQSPKKIHHLLLASEILESQSSNASPSYSLQQLQQPSQSFALNQITCTHQNTDPSLLSALAPFHEQIQPFPFTARNSHSQPAEIKNGHTERPRESPDLLHKIALLEQENKRLKAYIQNVASSKYGTSPGLATQSSSKSELEIRIKKADGEVSAKQETIRLLSQKLKSLETIQSIQESEILKSVLPRDQTIPNLVSRWREKVFELLVQSKTTEYAHQQDISENLNTIAKLKDQISTLTSQKAVAEHHISALNAEVELQATSIKNLEAKLRAETAVREAETKQIEEYREIQKKTAEKIKSYVYCHVVIASEHSNKRFFELPTPSDVCYLYDSFTVSLSNFNAQVYKKMVVLSSRISFAIDRIAVMGELQRGNYTAPNAKHVTQNLNEQTSFVSRSLFFVLSLPIYASLSSVSFFRLFDDVFMQENSLNRDTSADIKTAQDESEHIQLLRHQISVMQEEREVFLRRIRSDEKLLAEYRREENTKLQSLENDLQYYIAELECRKNELENEKQRTHSLREENQSLKKENRELKDGLRKVKDRGGIELTTQLKLEREKTSLLIDRLRERIAELEQEKKQLESNPIQSAGPSLATSSSVASHSRTLEFDSSSQPNHSESIKNLVFPSSFYIDKGNGNSHKIVIIDDTNREEYKDMSNGIPNRSSISPQEKNAVVEFDEQDTESEEDESQEAELEEQGTQERKKELRSDEKKKLLMLAEMTEQLLK
ncbi:hypothetical protein BKA69DRAFT_1038815 [Paraphysoderma sedebokerense]|nr:hypothetical protein BKA69DRAFT_1038815 [Paraphysoderma sedebokerense]